MTNNPNQPHRDDAVLGEKSQLSNAATLGGLEGVKRRLASQSDTVRIAAVKDALNYGKEGLELIVQIIKTQTGLVKWTAYNLVWERVHEAQRQKLRKYSFKSVLPELTAQGMVQRLGRGKINNVIPLSSELVMVCATGGAALFNLNGEALWEIDCPAEFSAMSPDGTLLALGRHKDIYLWDLRTGKLLRHLQGIDVMGVVEVAFSPDSKLLASGSNRSVQLWDVASGQQLHLLEPRWSRGHEITFSPNFSPDGKLLALVRQFDDCNDCNVRLWDMVSGQEVQLLQGHKDEVWSVVFSPDGKLLASGSSDKTVRLWDVASGQQLQLLQGHTDMVDSIAFSPDGRLLASGSNDGKKKTVRLWDVASGKQLHLLQVQAYTSRTDRINIAFSPDSKLLALRSDDLTVQLWDVASGQQLQCLQGQTDADISTVVFSPDSKLFASSGLPSTVQLWDVASGQQLHLLQAHTDKVTSIAFSPDGKLLASGSNDKTVRLWDVASSQQLHLLQAHTDKVTSIAFSPDGKLLASGSNDKTVRLWDVASSQQLRLLQGHTDKVTSLAFSPDGKLLASGSDDKTVRLWDLSVDQRVQILEHMYEVKSVSFSPDSKLLEVGSDGVFYSNQLCQLWDLASGELVQLIQPHTKWHHSSGQLVQLREEFWKVTSHITFNVDGKLLASLIMSGLWGSAVFMWDVASGESVNLLLEDNPIQSAVFSPDGKLLASVRQDSTVQLWDVFSGQKLQSLQGHTNSASSVVFSPDGKLLASVAGGVVRLWQLTH